MSRTAVAAKERTSRGAYAGQRQAYQRKYYLAHLDEQRRSKREYARRPEIAARRSEYMGKYRSRKGVSERMRETSQRWYQKERKGKKYIKRASRRI